MSGEVLGAASGKAKKEAEQEAARGLRWSASIVGSTLKVRLYDA